MGMGLFEALLEYGSMGLFAAFLVWQHLSMQKRFDKLVERFQTQLEGIQEKSDAAEDKLRVRYDSVIATYQEDKTAFRDNVAGRVTEVFRKLEEVEKQVDALPFDAVLIQIESVSMALRSNHQILEKGMGIMDDMKEEAKIKEMARKLSSDKDG